VVLGNKVSQLGLSTHAEKLKAVWKLEAPKTKKSLEAFIGLAMYFAAYIPFFSWMATPLFKLMRSKDISFDWSAKHQHAFETIKLALVSAPVRGHPVAGQAYRLYTDASDYTLAGALQQIQLMAVKDLKNTRVYARIKSAYERGEGVPELTTKLSQEIDDQLPTPNWAESWEDTKVPVERVIAYYSRVLASAETRYSAME
jgi:hypothetical protein